MTHDRLYQDPALARFYDLDNHWGPDDAYIHALAQGRSRILDLGCGTGRLATRLALDHGNQITGVDPARPMLDIARQKHGADRVTWIEADARRLCLDQTFDLITLTGHAFQCFLTEDDRAALAATLATHLAPDGLFLFDSRNPACREWEEWHPETSHEWRDLPGHGRTESWNDAHWDETCQTVTYQTFYRTEADGRLHQAASRIAFPTKAQIAGTLTEAGLAVVRWMGDWTGGRWHEDSPEIIPIGRKT